MSAFPLPRRRRPPDDRLAGGGVTRRRPLATAPSARPPPPPRRQPPVRAQPVGDPPDGPKRATVVTSATGPLTWRLAHRLGRRCSGPHRRRGTDAASGQPTEVADFSSYGRTGSGYVLTVDGTVSDPFDIRADLYDGLRSDALAFFYHQRSGIPIEASLVGSAYARPAGIWVAPNQGDTNVPCQSGVCDYTQDVRGGWYDAGDQGKYVVNEGSTWLLVNSFERAKRAGTASALGDSTLRVPERGNGVPDVLDEARWELDFLMRMQVPDGRPYAGMAFHKVHDAAWTGLPTRPEQDAQPRELHPPSTAATLNLAAIGGPVRPCLPVLRHGVRGTVA